MHIVHSARTKEVMYDLYSYGEQVLQAETLPTVSRSPVLCSRT